ncbi:PadR family transcriptional regulator [Microbispora cellulosiformans]|uniref:PadR family transcriptional regulator n=1 Tax=Microbispora cellulosiformans TaxID=2614688 RepID=A0A5J5JX01_9ACTN|nr:PadR family transcriptional regulator [Microbispora cellulosiformans]
MSPPVRVTKPLLDVLETLITALHQGYELHGWAIIKATGRSGPTVYGVLDRLEDAGWIEGNWEDRNPDPSKPARRFYKLTGVGLPAARNLLLERRPRSLRTTHEVDGSLRRLLGPTSCGGSTL